MGIGVLQFATPVPLDCQTHPNFSKKVKFDSRPANLLGGRSSFGS